MKKILVITTLLLLSLLAFVVNVKATSMKFQMQPLVQNPAQDQNPSIVQDSSGRIWVFFLSLDRIDAGHYHIFYITSTDGGNTWTEPALFLPAYVPGDSVGAAAAVFVDSTGKLWVAWQYGYVFFTTSSDGVNWADAKPLSVSGDDKVGSFIETQGKIWFFLSSSDSGWMQISYETTVDGGNSWSDLTAITGSGYFYPHAIVLSNGTIFVSYTRYPNGLCYSTSSDGGSTWSEATFDNPDSDRDPYCIEYGEQIYVFFNRFYTDFWHPPYNSENILFRVSDKNGWNPPQQMTNDSDKCNNCAFPAHVGNQIWLVWSKSNGDSTTQADIWLAKTPPSISATLKIDPETLNLKSAGKWVTTYIELPKGYDVHDVNVTSINLNGTIPVAPSSPVTIGDYDNDGIPDLMVKFDRQALANLILTNWHSNSRTGTVTLALAGKLKDGKLFQGSTTISVILPKK
jgi:hypothetical protein